MQVKQAGLGDLLDVRGERKGGMKDDSLFFGLSHWCRVGPFADMCKTGGGKCGTGKSRALCRPFGFEMLMKHSGINVKQAAGSVNLNLKEVCARNRNVGDSCMSTILKVMAMSKLTENMNAK